MKTLFTIVPALLLLEKIGRVLLSVFSKERGLFRSRRGKQRENFVPNPKEEGIMAISSIYGKIEISKIGDDEPIFILRAQDKLAASAIEMYRSLAASHGSHVTELLSQESERFRSWGGLKKMPD